MNASVQCCTFWPVLVSCGVWVCVCVSVFWCFFGLVFWWGGGPSSVILVFIEGEGGQVREGVQLPDSLWDESSFSLFVLAWRLLISSLIEADWRSCVSGGWDHLQCWGLAGETGVCKCPGGGGEKRHQWFFSAALTIRWRDFCYYYHFSAKILSIYTHKDFLCVCPTVRGLTQTWKEVTTLSQANRLQRRFSGKNQISPPVCPLK